MQSGQTLFCNGGLTLLKDLAITIIRRLEALQAEVCGLRRLGPENINEHWVVNRGTEEGDAWFGKHKRVEGKEMTGMLAALMPIVVLNDYGCKSG